MIRIAPGYKELVEEGRWGWQTGLISPTGLLYVHKRSMVHATLLREIGGDKYADHPLYKDVFAAIIDGWVRLVSEDTTILYVEVFDTYYKKAVRDIQESDAFVSFKKALFDVHTMIDEEHFKTRKVDVLLMPDDEKGFSLNPKRKR